MNFCLFIACLLYFRCSALNYCIFAVAVATPVILVLAAKCTAPGIKESEAKDGLTPRQEIETTGSKGLTVDEGRTRRRKQRTDATKLTNRRQRTDWDAGGKN